MYCECGVADCQHQSPELPDGSANPYAGQIIENDHGKFKVICDGFVPKIKKITANQ